MARGQPKYTCSLPVNIVTVLGSDMFTIVVNRGSRNVKHMYGKRVLKEVLHQQGHDVLYEASETSFEVGFYNQLVADATYKWLRVQMTQLQQQ